MQENGSTLKAAPAAGEWEESLIMLSSQFYQRWERKPCFAILSVGNSAPSKTYIQRKILKASTMGIHSLVFAMEETIGEQLLLKKIEELNTNPCVDGILLQLPLPAHLDTYVFCQAIHPLKDVDGLHQCNQGKVLWGKNDGLTPCTPLGIMYLLKHYNIALKGKHAVIVGRSNLVGNPLSQLFTYNDATVTLAHSKTQALYMHTSQADILVSAVGKGHFLDAPYLKEKTLAIDVGLAHRNGALIGDINVEALQEKQCIYTPIPGGVGPMTVMGLMHNVLKAAHLLHGLALENFFDPFNKNNKNVKSGKN